MKGILLFLFFSFGFLSAQNSEDTNSFEIDFLAGNILNHAPDISHLITGHPDGIFATFSKKTHGNKPWQKLYNYPDYGFYFLYQDFKNEFLGSNYALGAHYNFYFLKRNLNREHLNNWKEYLSADHVLKINDRFLFISLLLLLEKI